MDYHFILLIIYYFFTILVGISEYRYNTRIKPLQSHLWRLSITVSIWVILIFSTSLLFDDILSSYIAGLIFAGIWFLLDYDNSQIYYFNCAGLEKVTVIEFINTHMRKSGFTINDYSLEERKCIKVLEFKIRFHEIEKSKLQKGISLFLSDCKNNQSLLYVKKRTIFFQLFSQFIIPAIFYCYLLFQTLHT